MPGVHPGAPAPVVTVVGACAIVCYAAVARSPKETKPTRALQLLFAALVVGSTTAPLVWFLARLTGVGFAPQAEHFAVIRTLVACTAALGLAWCGSRWPRRELIWLSWAALGLIGIKLLLEDLRHGHL